MSETEIRSQRRLADRLFSLLEAFTVDRPRLTLSEISRRTGLPIATAHRLAAHLVGSGALDRGNDGLYSIGIHLWEIACREHRALALREAALPAALWLREATGSVVLLSVLDGLDAVVIEHLANGDHNGVGGRVGTRDAAQESAGGRVLLAYQRSADMLKPPLQHLLVDIRRAGIAVVDGRPRDQAFSAAAPVGGASGAVIAALSVVGLPHGQDGGMVIQAVRCAAQEITRAIGGQPPGEPLWVWPPSRPPRPLPVSPHTGISLPESKAGTA